MHPYFADLTERFDAMLNDLAKTVEGLPPQALDWTPGADMNSLNVLLTHSAGATRYWVGDVAMNDSSNRDRAAEFATAGISEAVLKERLEVCRAYVHQALAALTLDDLTVMRDVPAKGRTYSVGWSILHALEHLASHVGHAQITRQLWDSRQ